MEGKWPSDPLERIRRLCLALPDTSERLSDGRPAFFIADKSVFVMFMDDHHGDGRLAIWCAAEPKMQDMLVDLAPDSYFVPAYVGHRGWIGVRLDRGLDWDEVAGHVEDAYLARRDAGRVAPRAAGPRSRKSR